MRFPKKKRIKLSRTKYVLLKKYVYRRDSYCVFCGRTDSATPAHVIRRSQGGNDAPNNLVRACQECHDLYDQYQIELPEHTRRMLEGEPVTL